MHLHARPVELVFERRGPERREPARDVLGRAREHRAHGLEQPQLEARESRRAVRERGRGHGRDSAREHDRAAHVRGRQPGGRGDRVAHHAFERALAQLADEQPREEALLALGRVTKQRLEDLAPAIRAALARDARESLEPCARRADRERRVRRGRNAAQVVDRRGTEPEPPARQRAREPRDRGLALVGAERAQARDEQLDLREPAARRGNAVRGLDERGELHGPR